jgi:hypothetical protein
MGSKMKCGDCGAEASVSIVIEDPLTGHGLLWLCARCLTIRDTPPSVRRELAALRREVAELRAALKPFAEAAASDTKRRPLTIGHLRAARDVLTRWRAEGGAS